MGKPSKTAKLLCPHCACPRSRVVDTRPVTVTRNQQSSVAIKRRRKCGKCKKKYGTIETYIPTWMKGEKQ